MRIARLRSFSPRMMLSTFCRLGHTEGCRRLVHQHELRRPMRRPGDRDALALAAGKVADRRLRRRDAHIEFPDQRLRLRDHPLAVEAAERTRDQLTAEEHVHVDRLLVGQRQVLVDDLDAMLLRAGRDWRSCASCPSIRMRPAVGGWTPAMIFTSVDLPAPLSPTSATTSPAMQVQVDILDARRRRRTPCGCLAAHRTGAVTASPPAGRTRHGSSRPPVAQASPETPAE